MADNTENVMRVYNKTGMTIPPKSFVKIITGLSNYAFQVARPDKDNIQFSKLAVVRDELADEKVGLAYIDGIFVVKKTAGEIIVEGDSVGTDKDEFTAIKIGDDAYGNNDGQFYVLFVDGDDLTIRPKARESLVASI